jgi:hypothetical protein
VLANEIGLTMSLSVRGKEKREKRMKLRFVIVMLLAVCFASAASAQKTGTESYTTYYVTVSVSTLQLGTDHTMTATEFQGVTRSDRPGGMFDNMTARCIGTREVAAGIMTSQGSCTEMYPDGSQTFSTYLSKGPISAQLTGFHTFVGGTGKYAGISGKAEYTAQALKAPDTARMFAAHHTATFTLP